MSATKTGVSNGPRRQSEDLPRRGVQELINHLPYDDIAKVVDAIWEEL